MVGDYWGRLCLDEGFHQNLANGAEQLALPNRLYQLGGGSRFPPARGITEMSGRCQPHNSCSYQAGIAMDMLRQGEPALQPILKGILGAHTCHSECAASTTLLHNRPEYREPQRGFPYERALPAKPVGPNWYR